MTRDSSRKLAEQIARHARNYLLYVDGSFEYDNDTSFMAEGLIDSVGVMELLTYVESEFDITVEQNDVTPENFDSVNKLAAFVRRKQSEPARSWSCQAAARRTAGRKSYGDHASV